MNKLFVAILVSASVSLYAHGQTIQFEGKKFEVKNVTASVAKLNGKET